MEKTSLTLAAAQASTVHWINDIVWPILGMLIMLSCVLGSAWLIRQRNHRRALEAKRAAQTLNPRTVRQRAISEPNWLDNYRPKQRQSGVDDLTRIEGIGPKVCALLIEQGITQYSQLARVPVDLIKRALRSQGKPFAMIDPQSWPAQAALAANGQWDALQHMQRHLVGGRKRGGTSKTLRVKCMSVPGC